MLLRFRKLNQANRQSGAILIVVALAMAAVIAMVAIAVDTGLYMRNRFQLMTAGDLAALFGTKALTDSASSTEASSLAKLIAEANLRAMGHSQRALDESWLPKLQVTVEQEDQRRTVLVRHQLDQKMFFSGVLDALGAAKPLVATSSSATALLGSSEAPSPITTVLLIDRAAYMNQYYQAGCLNAPLSCLQGTGPCPKSCIRGKDAALELAKEFISQLKDEDALAILVFDSRVNKVFPLVQLTEYQRQRAVGALEYFFAQPNPADQSSNNSPNYAAVLWQTLEVLRNANKNGIIGYIDTVEVVLISGGATSTFNPLIEPYPRDPNCENPRDRCTRKLIRCRKSGKSKEACILKDQRCRSDMPTLNEEHAGMFRQQLQEDFNGRLHAIGIANFGLDQSGDPNRDRRKNLLIELSADLDAVRSGPRTRLSCSEVPSASSAGMLITPEPTQQELHEAVTTILEEARNKTQSNSERPHLVEQASL